MRDGGGVLMSTRPCGLTRKRRERDSTFTARHAARARETAAAAILASASLVAATAAAGASPAPLPNGWAPRRRSPSPSSPVEEVVAPAHSYGPADDEGVGCWQSREVLGRGAHAVVYRGELACGESVAVKQIHTDGMSAAELRSVENEIRVMRQLSHPNVVRYLGMEKAENALNLFLEYVDGGSLDRLLKRTGPMTETMAASTTRQMVLGLRYLHARGITHRDVKGANVLVCRSAGRAVVKLADFGASKRLGHESLLSGLKGTPHWMAPEVIRGQQTATGWFKADVWSVGCTVVEMLTGKMPWPEITNPMAAMWRVAEGEAPPLNCDVSTAARAFVAACCASDPRGRHSARQLLCHDFLDCSETSLHLYPDDECEDSPVLPRQDPESPRGALVTDAAVAAPMHGPTSGLGATSPSPPRQQAPRRASRSRRAAEPLAAVTETTAAASSHGSLCRAANTPGCSCSSASSTRSPTPAPPQLLPASSGNGSGSGSGGRSERPPARRPSPAHRSQRFDGAEWGSPTGHNNGNGNGNGLISSSDIFPLEDDGGCLAASLSNGHDGASIGSLCERNSRFGTSESSIDGSLASHLSRHGTDPCSGRGTGTSHSMHSSAGGSENGSAGSEHGGYARDHDNDDAIEAEAAEGAGADADDLECYRLTRCASMASAATSAVTPRNAAANAALAGAAAAAAAAAGSDLSGADADFDAMQRPRIRSWDCSASSSSARRPSQGTRRAGSRRPSINAPLLRVDSAGGAAATPHSNSFNTSSGFGMRLAANCCSGGGCVAPSTPSSSSLRARSPRNAAAAAAAAANGCCGGRSCAGGVLPPHGMAPLVSPSPRAAACCASSGGSATVGRSPWCFADPAVPQPPPPGAAGCGCGGMCPTAVAASAAALRAKVGADFELATPLTASLSFSGHGGGGGGGGGGGCCSHSSSFASAGGAPLRRHNSGYNSPIDVVRAAREQQEGQVNSAAAAGFRTSDAAGSSEFFRMDSLGSASGSGSARHRHRRHHSGASGAAAAAASAAGAMDAAPCHGSPHAFSASHHAEDGLLLGGDLRILRTKSAGVQGSRKLPPLEGASSSGAEGDASGADGGGVCGGGCVGRLPERQIASAPVCVQAACYRPAQMRRMAALAPLLLPAVAAAAVGEGESGFGGFSGSFSGARTPRLRRGAPQTPV